MGLNTFLGDCGCLTCESKNHIIGDGYCNIELHLSPLCCSDGGDCSCLALANPLVWDGDDTEEKCCPEYGQKYCFAVSNICPTCSMMLIPVIGNGICDEDVYFNPNCCFDAGDCDEHYVTTYLILSAFR